MPIRAFDCGCFVVTQKHYLKIKPTKMHTGTEEALKKEIGYSEGFVLSFFPSI
jgi:hypothetical protein